MNLMPYKCKTKQDEKCEWDCDYTYYGHEPICFKPMIYNGLPIPNPSYTEDNINFPYKEEFLRILSEINKDGENQ